MGFPHRQSVSEISYSLGIHVITLCKFRKTWRLQGEVMPCFQGNPEDCEPLDKFKVLQEKIGLKTMECTVATGSAACSLSRWTVGHMPPRIPMRSFYSPWPMRKSSRSAIPRVPDPSNALISGALLCVRWIYLLCGVADSFSNLFVCAITILGSSIFRGPATLLNNSRLHFHVS